MSNKPIVSVCLTSYNGSKYIYEQISSILKQIDSKDELVISDDSSTDSTLDIIKSINDKRIKLYCNNTFHSPIKNFENALKKATGDIIFLSDQDDVWLPNKYKTMMNNFDRYDLVVSDGIITDSNLNYTGKTLYEIRNSKQGFFKNIYKNSYVGCCMAFKRELLDIALPFPNTIAMHDMWLGLLGELACNIGFINNPLILYRRHECSASQTGNKSNKTLLEKLLYRYQIFFLTILARFMRRLK